MATKLIEDIVNIEKEAGSIIARASEEAKRFEEVCEEEISAYRRTMTEETNRRISEFRKEAEEAFRIALDELKMELSAALDDLEHIPDDLLQAQAARIVSRLKYQ
jgi:hypothetical protein